VQSGRVSSRKDLSRCVTARGSHRPGHKDNKSRARLDNESSSIGPGQVKLGSVVSATMTESFDYEICATTRGIRTNGWSATVGAHATNLAMR
jgi:hypothetical protein